MMGRRPSGNEGISGTISEGASPDQAASTVASAETSKNRRVRRNGEGSVFQLGNGKWVAEVTGDDGRSIRRQPKKNTPEAAQVLLAELLGKQSAGELTKGGTTLRQ